MQTRPIHSCAALSSFVWQLVPFARIDRNIFNLQTSTNSARIQLHRKGIVPWTFVASQEAADIKSSRSIHAQGTQQLCHIAQQYLELAFKPLEA